MGSPNFKTVNTLANFASDWDAEDDFFNPEFEMELRDNVYVAANEIEESFFSKVVIESGYQSGFQIYVQEDTTPEIIFNAFASDWAASGEVCVDTDNGFYEFKNAEFVAHAKAGTLTLEMVKAEYNKEQKRLIDGVTAIAREFNLGRIEGKTWTSHVNYNWKDAA